MPDLLTSAASELARLPSILESLTAGLADADWRRRPASDEWSPLELVCHLRDEELEDFETRLRAGVEGEPGYPSNDPESWPQQRRYLEDDPDVVLNTLLR